MKVRRCGWQARLGGSICQYKQGNRNTRGTEASLILLLCARAAERNRSEAQYRIYISIVATCLCLWRALLLLLQWRA